MLKTKKSKVVYALSTICYIAFIVILYDLQPKEWQLPLLLIYGYIYVSIVLILGNKILESKLFGFFKKFYENKNKRICLFLFIVWWILWLIFCITSFNIHFSILNLLVFSLLIILLLSSQLFLAIPAFICFIKKSY